MSDDATLRLDLTPHDLLTEQDMLELTGVSRPDMQARCLAANNIYFLVNHNNIPKTTWYHVNNPIHLRTPSLSMTDFGYGFTKTFHPKRDSSVPMGLSRDSWVKRMNKFLDKVFAKIEDDVPPHIKQQIKDNAERLGQMEATAEEQRQRSKTGA